MDQKFLSHYTISAYLLIIVRFTKLIIPNLFTIRSKFKLRVECFKTEDPGYKNKLLPNIIVDFSGMFINESCEGI